LYKVDPPLEDDLVNTYPLAFVQVRYLLDIGSLTSFHWSQFNLLSDNGAAKRTQRDDLLSISSALLIGHQSAKLMFNQMRPPDAAVLSVLSYLLQMVTSECALPEMCNISTIELF
jgi:hypothetical protein